MASEKSEKTGNFAAECAWLNWRAHWVSDKYVSPVFKEEFQVNVSDYIAMVRVEHAKQLLSKGIAVNAAAQQVDIDSRATFIRMFKKSKAWRLANLPTTLYKRRKKEGKFACGKGRLFACFYGGELEEQHGNYAVLAVSDDTGYTWTEPYLVVSHPDERMRVFDPCLWMDPLGRLWFTWSQSLGYFDGMHGVWASVCDAPDAPQPTFGPPRRIANGVMMCKPIVLSDGAWLFPCAVWSKWARPEEAPETEGERFSNAVVTTDLGQTFVRRGGADVKNRCFDEHMVVERKDHSLWMLVRRYDGSYHWVGRGHSGIPGPCSRFFLRRLRSGKLLLINHVDFRGRNNLAARLSDDDGKTWSTGLLLDGRDNVSYPDGVEDENGTLYVIYDRERLKDREILLAVFREEDILRGAMEQQDLCLVERRVVSKAGVRE